jgi:hypothetical protein
MKLAELFRRYRAELDDKYACQLLPEQRRAVDSIVKCRTPDCGETLVLCPHCHHHHHHAHSCGHRSCPQCQNHTATQWLQRQQAKLLPVRYYLLTFTVPSELRTTVYRNQRLLFEAMFSSVTDTIREVASNPRYLGAEPGMTTVLHTHSRTREYHPHIHVIMPGGGIDKKARLWKQQSRKYMFPAAVLKKLYREKFLALCRHNDISYPDSLHRKHWVVNIKAAGRGKGALKYLSKYLYRGVIQERNILGDTDGNISFEYEESKTGLRKTRTLPAPDFLFLTLKHTLPKRFRRTRDHGFLHGNAKKTLRLVQYLLKCAPEVAKLEPPEIRCPFCRIRFTLSSTRYERRAPALTRNRGSP